MITQVYSIYDSKAGVFHRPFYMHYEAEAMRACIELASDNSTTPGKYPHDFSLFHLGAFDDNKGTFELQIPRNLGVLATFLANKEQ